MCTLAQASLRGVAWTTHGQNPCDFRPGPGCYGGSGYRASFRTDVPLGRCPTHAPFGPCWRFSVFSLSTSTLWAKAGVPVLRLRSSVSSGLWVEWGKGWFSRWDEAAAGRAGERGCRRPKKPCRRWRPSTLARAAVIPVLGRFTTWSRRGPRCKPGSAKSGGFETRARFARIQCGTIAEFVRGFFRNCANRH